MTYILFMISDDSFRWYAEISYSIKLKKLKQRFGRFFSWNQQKNAVSASFIDPNFIIFEFKSFSALIGALYNILNSNIKIHRKMIRVWNKKWWKSEQISNFENLWKLHFFSHILMWLKHYKNWTNQWNSLK